jgi:hypothetical protein
MQQLTTEQKNIIFKDNRPLMSKDLCELYGVTRYHLRKMLTEVADKIGERCGYYFTPKQVITFVHHFGFPEKTTIRTAETTNC